MFLFVCIPSISFKNPQSPSVIRILLSEKINTFISCHVREHLTTSLVCEAFNTCQIGLWKNLPEPLTCERSCTFDKHLSKKVHRSQQETDLFYQDKWAVLLSYFSSEWIELQSATAVLHILLHIFPYLMYLIWFSPVNKCMKSNASASALDYLYLGMLLIPVFGPILH